MLIIDNIKSANPRIDFSGGDLLLVPDNIEVVKKASNVIGRENVGITTTGVGMKQNNFIDYLNYVSEVEFTYDQTRNDYDYRQSGYNRSNLNAITKIRNKGIKTRALIPLTQTNLDAKTIQKIYTALNSIGVDSVLLMRIFPVGRGASLTEKPLSRTEYIKIIENYKEIENKYLVPKIKLQCSLKYLFPNQVSVNPCGFLYSSLGISNIGQLITSAWAYDQKGNILSPEFILGDLTVDNIANLTSKKIIKNFISRKDENFGHCKMFAFLNNNKDQNINKLFSKSDPLYLD